MLSINSNFSIDETKRPRVLVIGLGFVGLTFALHAASKGLQIYGLEKNSDVVTAIRGGNAHFRENGINEVLRSQINKNFHVASLQEGVPDVDFGVAVITVGTPVDQDGEVDMGQLTAAWSIAIKAVRDGGLIILRSTVAIGTSRRLAMQVQSDRNLFIAFCPERTVEGAALIELDSLPQLVSQYPDGPQAEQFFSLIASDIINCSSDEQAEAAKLLCNVYRDLHFSLANIFELVCENMSLSPLETFAVAGERYPRLGLPLPGFVGGPCLSKDAHILAGSLSDASLREWVLIGRRVNEKRLLESACKIRRLLIADRSNAEECHILLCGMAFKGKPSTDDLRDSSSVALYNIVAQYDDFKIFVHDVEISDDILMQEFQHVWTAVNKIQQTHIDIVVVLNTHQYYQCEDIMLLNKLGLATDTEVLRL